MHKCKMEYLVTSSSTWESDDNDFSFCYHDLLEEYNTNLNDLVEMEGSEILATSQTFVNNLSDLSNLDNELSCSSSSDKPTPSQGKSRERRVCAVSGEWYRRVCRQDTEWVYNELERKSSKEAFKEKRSIAIGSVERKSKKTKTQPTGTDDLPIPTDSEAPLQNTDIKPPNKMLRCYICRKLFQSKSSLEKHRQLVHAKEHECPTCGKFLACKVSLAMHLSFHSDARPHKCDTCGNTFKTKNCLRRHKKIHTGATPFKCSYCDKAFAIRYRCKAHESIHDLTLRLACDECGKTFTTNGDLTSHKKVRHSSLGYPFKCTTCGRGFMTERKFKDHLNVHTGKTPYECNVCGKKYKSEPVLEEHKKTHIPYTERPLKCKLCTARFWIDFQLLNHMEVHHLPKVPAPKVFVCRMCNMEFSDEKVRRIHRESHLVCNVCHKKFRVRKAFKDHMKLHPYAEQPINCKLCGSRFWFESELLKHMKVSHPPEAAMVYACKVCKKEFTDKKDRTIHHIEYHIFSNIDVQAP